MGASRFLSNLSRTSRTSPKYLPRTFQMCRNIDLMLEKQRFWRDALFVPKAFLNFRLGALCSTLAFFATFGNAFWCFHGHLSGPTCRLLPSIFHFQRGGPWGQCGVSPMCLTEHCEDCVLLSVSPKKKSTLVCVLHGGPRRKQ